MSQLTGKAHPDVSIGAIRKGIRIPKVTGGDASKFQLAREKPARATFNTEGENMCVSCRLKTCARKMLEVWVNGLAPGVRLLPSSML